MLYVPNSQEETPSDHSEYNASGSLPSCRYNNADNIQKSFDSETSFDSGYVSPMAGRHSQFPPSVQDSALYSTTIVQQSPAKLLGIPSVVDDPSRFRGFTQDFPMLDDWDKNFIENFEENLFSLDCPGLEDSGLLEGILKSPLKSPLRILSPAKGASNLSILSPAKSPGVSPYKTLLHRSPYRSGHVFTHIKNGKTIRTTNSNRIAATGPQTMPSGVRNKSGYVMPASGYQTGPKILTAGIVSNPVNILSASENTIIGEVAPIPVNYSAISQPKKPKIHPKTVSQICKTKENTEPPQSRQKLQMARAHFRLSLEKAIENADSRSAQLKSYRYPQLSMALSKPTADQSMASVPSSPTSTVDLASHPYLEKNSEIPFSWFGEPGSEVGAYEVEPQSDCKVVIRKKKR